ncbi:MAG: glucose/arabinose dehydrogenase, partial [Mariniblastus sp.]
MPDREFQRPAAHRSISSFRTLWFGLVMVAGVLVPTTSNADEPQWIWSPKLTAGNQAGAVQECYFRKRFNLVRPLEASLELSAGDEYEIFINGRLATRGQSFGHSTQVDISELVQSGINLIAAKVRHFDGPQAGLGLKIRIKEKSESRWRSLVSDHSWKTRVGQVESWNSPSYNDMGWLSAQALGRYDANSRVAIRSSAQTSAALVSTQAKPNVTLAQMGGSSSQASQNLKVATAVRSKFGQGYSNNPALTPLSMKMDLQANTAASKRDQAPPKTVNQQKRIERKFEIDPEFTVQQVLGGDETGSLIAMEFNEFGKLLLSREGGPLLIADPTRQVGDPLRVRVYCDQVSTCQGIVALNGDVFVTGNGPQGLGLYRLHDSDRDGMLEVQTKLAGFNGELGEHGPHGLQLGPDGMLYVIIGNGSSLQGTPAKTSPFQHAYEGGLLPRMEDPGGHAKGVKAPGGTVVRISLDGQKTEIVAGGIRNAYDLVFDHEGELFLHDSDMEADIGMTWYRPTMIFHVPAGADLGWRSGWSKFPQYYADQTPAICETGRGSPSGAVSYQHLQFPVRYQNTLFFADWSEGRILSVQTQKNGAGYTAQAETFLKGRPLNVVDLAVGEDGGLYFCTGGRGTEGGVFRVTWNGSVPENILEFESTLAKIIRHPQPNSAWARQSIFQLKTKLGDKWQPSIEGVAKEKRNTSRFRQRALDTMVFFGPAPSSELLEELSYDESPELRVHVARLCGLTQGENTKVLDRMLRDESAAVRRAACESYLRSEMTPEPSALFPLLKSLDRVEAQVARRILERIPSDQWEMEIMATDDKRLFVHGAIALMTADPNLDRGYKVLARASQFMEGFVNDYDFVDMLRAMELALVRGEVEPERVPGLQARISNEFPSGSSAINRELSRMMAFLSAGELKGRLEAYLQDPAIEISDKIHVAMQLQTAGNKLTPDVRLAVIEMLETGQRMEDVGGSYPLYLQKAVENLVKTITKDQIPTVLKKGHLWPNAVVAAFHKLPEKLDRQTIETIIEMDQEVLETGNTEAVFKQVRLGVIAVLARSGDQRSMAYLRQMWQQEPSRRNDITIGLAQQPDAENWAYLVSSLPVLDDLTGTEVVQKLKLVARRPSDSRHFRELISIGYRLRGQDKNATVGLLEHWAGKAVDNSGKGWQIKLNSWRDWFHQTWPEEEEINLPGQPEVSGKYSIDQLLTGLDSAGVGNALMGHAVFVKAQCANCHQFDGAGKAVGPDLSSLAHRFSLRESIEATV